MACENKDAFQPLIAYARTITGAVQNNTFNDDITEAAILYNNAKFYYTNNEFNGALVSYSCAAVLLNSIVRQLPQNGDQQRKASELLIIISKFISKSIKRNINLWSSRNW